MSKEKEVTRMIRPKLGEAGWKTVRSALDSWPRTARLSVIMLVVSTPPFGLVWIIAERFTGNCSRIASPSEGKALAGRGRAAFLFQGHRGTGCSMGMDACSFIVAALRVIIRVRPQCAGCIDSPSVPVGNHRADPPQARIGIVLVEINGPGLWLLNRRCGECVEACLHEVFPLGQGLSHAGVGDAYGAGDRADDQPGCPAWGGRVDGGDLLDLVPQQRSEVINAGEVACADDAWEEVVDVVPGGFEAA